MVPEKIKPIIREKIFRFQNRGFKPYSIHKKLEGLEFQFWIGDRTAQKWYDVDWNWQEVKFIKNRMINKGDVVLECGAHHGCLTIALSRWVGDEGKVVAFEALPYNAQVVQKNIDLNNIQNAKIEKKAVGASEGEVVISGGSNSQVVSSAQGTRVELTYLDKYLDLKPTFLKIDVEGFEAEVLKGAQKILKTVPKIALELHTPMLKNFGTSVEEIFSLIGVENYQFWI